jgi:hypothetical protein
VPTIKLDFSDVLKGLLSSNIQALKLVQSPLHHLTWLFGSLCSVVGVVSVVALVTGRFEPLLLIPFGLLFLLAFCIAGSVVWLTAHDKGDQMTLTGEHHQARFEGTNRRVIDVTAAPQEIPVTPPTSLLPSEDADGQSTVNKQ